jgi:hypothetical protein
MVPSMVKGLHTRTILLSTSGRSTKISDIGLNLFRGLGFLSITEGQRWLAERWEKLIVLST